MQRRTLLNLGIASAAALALAGGGAALLYEPAWHNQRLSEDGRGIVVAIARAVLDGCLSVEPAARQRALAGHLERMDTVLRNLPEPTQREIGDLLALLAMPPGRFALAGLGTGWAQASVAQLQGALQLMRTSRVALRQQAYHALRDLTHAAYFADSSTWAALGYPGPNPLG
jgi:hypothetical protein